MSIVSGTVGAVLSADAQGEATEAQERQAREYNELLRQMHSESRGSTGHAVLSEALGSTERQAGMRSAGVSHALSRFYGTPDDVAARGAAVAAKYRPLLDEGTKSLYGIFSGDLERKRLEAAEPTFAARRDLAGTTRAGAMKGILERLTALKADFSRGGYSGDSSAHVREGFRAQIEGNQAASAAEASANLQNAMDRQSIRDEILNLELRSPELAGALAAQAIKLETLPADVAAAISRGELAPLDYFRIGVGQPPRQEMAPWAQPNASLGQILASAGADAGNMAGRYFLNRDLANRYGRQAGGPYQREYAPYEDQSQWPAASDYDYYGYGGYGGWSGGEAGAASAANAAAAGAF